MNGDRLIIDLGHTKAAIDTTMVAGIVELEKVPFLLGRSGFVRGIISLRGEPVTVLDLRAVFGLARTEYKGPSKIIVAKDMDKLLGFDIGPAEISFRWKDETGSADADGAVKPIDFQRLFNATSRILSTEGPGA